ncbi:hypothetical protein BDZ88DRAFT_456140 [Geranomyces variabilis]|nr:hypothetical protein BDZ88DRAFT_456140 [Geranomyces variabilis]
MSTRVHVWRIRHEQWPYPLEYHDTREAPAPKWGLLQGVFAASKGQDMEGFSRDGRPGFRAPPQGGNPCTVRSYLGVRWVVTDDESNSPGIWDSLTPQNEATRRPRVMAFAFLDFHMETGVVVTNSAISRSDKEAGRSPIYEVLKQALEDHDKMAAAADASDARLVPARPKWLHMASHHFKNTPSKNQHEPLFKRLEKMPPDVTPWAAHIRASGTRPASTMCVENFIVLGEGTSFSHKQQKPLQMRIVSPFQQWSQIAHDLTNASALWAKIDHGDQANDRMIYNIAVTCADLHPVDVKGAARNAEALKKQFPLSDGSWAWLEAACINWVFEQNNVFRGPWDACTRTMILIIGNTYDPATPLRMAQHLASLMPNSSRLLVHNGHGHCSSA